MGLPEQIVTIEAPATSIRACSDRKLDTHPMRVRLLRIELDSGESEVLITSLLDVEQFPYHLFAELYHDRWSVKEDYKVMKCRIEMENFSGKSNLSVYQDFHARTFSKNITSMLAFATKSTVEQTTEGRKHNYRANFTHALSTMRDAIALLFQESTKIVKEIITDLLDTFASAIESERLGRKYPRNHKRAQRKNCITYKSIL